MYMESLMNLEECDDLQMLAYVLNYLFGGIILIVGSPPFSLHRV